MAITKEELDEIIAKYNRGEPTGYTDEEYDILLEDYLAEHGEDKRPFLRQKQSDAVNDIVGTLTKAYGVTTAMRENQKSYADWVQKNTSKRSISMESGIIIQPKFDGCSVACDLRTGRFFTRGDYDNGESVDVTDIFEDKLDWILGIVEPNTVAIKFEAILDEHTYRNSELKSYTRARDAVQATIASHNKKYAELITLVPLRAIDDMQRQYIPRPMRAICIDSKLTDFRGIENYISERLEAGATVELFERTYAIDGVVVSVMTSQNYIDPYHEIAIKILYNVKETKLLSIKWQFGKQGRITPVAILEPVMFDNVTVDHATISTLQRVVDMKLRHNDTVRIMYNIVPYFLDSKGDGDFPIPVPERCPICGEKLDYLSYKLVRCSNPCCKGLKLGAIIRHAEKMRMFGLSKGKITKLYDEAILTNIADLYRLKEKRDQIVNLPGFGETSYDNMVMSIDKALSEASLPRFLGALPFNDTDEKTWRMILTTVKDDDIIQTMKNGDFPDFIIQYVTYISGVSKLKIQKIIDGYLRNREEIQSMMTWIPSKLIVLDQNITRKGRVCFTGFRDKDLERELEENGWEIGGLTKDTKYLIVRDMDYQSDKVTKAKQLGIEIIPRDAASYYLDQPF